MISDFRDESVNFVIGHVSLHHLIKYEGVAKELGRVITPTGVMFFADSFGENKVYHLFHDKEEMERLGDVILTKPLIESFFSGFSVCLHPTDWFVMLDKLLLKIIPNCMNKLVRFLSFIW